MLQLDSDMYEELAYAFARHLGSAPSHVDPTWDTNKPDLGFEGSNWDGSVPFMTPGARFAITPVGEGFRVDALELGARSD